MKTKLLAIVLLFDLFVRLSQAEGQYIPPTFAAGAPAYCPPPAYAVGSPAYAVGSPAFPYSRTTPLQTLLYVKIGGPPGMKVTFYRDSKQAVSFDVPCVVGMRPGYFYRIAVSGMKQFPAQTFYPTIEVRGSLLLGSKLRACDYPAGLVFKEEDFTQAQDGSFIRKVIFVEKVENSLPQSSSPDDPLELIVPRNRDPLDEARDRGLPVMIVEIGERNFTVSDLLCQAIPGTLLPGDTNLPRPSVVPCLPWSCFPIYDPLLGPAPWLYYTLPDGGDWGEPVGYDRFGRLRGRDPSDTIAEYKDSKGNKQIAISNRVFLCIPRYIVAKSVPVARLGDLSAPLGPQAAQSSLTKLDMNAIFAPRGYDQRRHLELVADKLKAAGIDRLQVTAVTGRVQNLDVTATISGPASVTGQPQPKEAIGRPPEEGKDVPLKVDKWPDRCGGVVGDIITFFIRYTNIGGRDITNVIVSDNLITRFEYVPNSAQTSRAANFTVQGNNVGSSIVQWEIDGVLKPGESGTVSFQVKIR
jgi:uncharacterized repeat protein (TIGR01451 family)